MTTSAAVDYSRLDADIADAWQTVLACRAAWARSANSETIAAEEEAQARVDVLLEFRHRARMRELG